MLCTYVSKDSYMMVSFGILTMNLSGAIIVNAKIETLLLCLRKWYAMEICVYLLILAVAIIMNNEK